ncbi:hypothetical protein Bca4012_037981 [Brassica carinata]|uniref:Uncharacterized protein n=1 Tax=Brassica carinata TaxID=52824 RepID=A0A8X7W4G1_BRACI|nr:hypothetical protein Bca52824_006461 [Brassica carinata]
MRAPGEGTSGVGPTPLSLLTFSYDEETSILEDPERLASEEIGKHLLTIQQLRAEADSARERDEQHSKEIRELKERLTLSEGDKVALRGDLDLMREKSKREVESRNAVIRGFDIDEELACLRSQENSCDIDYALAAVSDTSLGRIDLPAISEESINQDSE